MKGIIQPNSLENKNVYCINLNVNKQWSHTVPIFIITHLYECSTFFFEFSLFLLTSNSSPIPSLNFGESFNACLTLMAPRANLHCVTMPSRDREIFESHPVHVDYTGLFPAILGKGPWPKLGKNDQLNI